MWLAFVTNLFVVALAIGLGASERAFRITGLFLQLRCWGRLEIDNPDCDLVLLLLDNTSTPAQLKCIRAVCRRSLQTARRPVHFISVSQIVVIANRSRYHRLNTMSACTPGKSPKQASRTKTESNADPPRER